MQKFQVRLERTAEERAPMVRAMRVIGKMSLNRAWRLYESLEGRGSTVLLAGVDKAVAEHIARGLCEAGAAAQVESCDIADPMVLEPRAGELYAWVSGRRLRKRPHG